MATIFAKRKTNCFFCGEAIEAGAKAQWYLRQGVRGGSRANGVSNRWVLCCDGKYPGQCETNRQHAERAQAEQESAEQIARVKEMTNAGRTVEEILDFLGIAIEQKATA